MVRELQKIESVNTENEVQTATQNLINSELNLDLQQLYDVKIHSEFFHYDFLLRQLAQKYSFEPEEFSRIFKNYTQKKSLESSQGFHKQSLQLGYFINHFSEQTANSKVVSIIAALSGVAFTLFQFGTQIHSFVTELKEQNTIARRQVIYEAWDIIRKNQDQKITDNKAYRSNGGVTQALQDLNSSEVNLSGLKIQQTQLVRLKLEQKADLSYSSFQGSNLNYSEFIPGTNFNESHLEKTRFFRAKLNNVYFINSHLNQAELTSAKINGANLTNADLTDADLTKAELKGANLTNANLTDAQLNRTNFKGANFQDVTWTNAELQEANLIEAKNIDPTKIREAKNWITATYNPEFIPELCWVHGGDIDSVDLSQYNCQQLYFKQLNSVDFSGANLQNVQLIKATLNQANLSQANLQNAQLHRVNLQGANLQYANLEKANLLCANLTNVANLEPQQVKKAANWRSAIYSKELSQKLGLKTKPSFRVCEK
ncbi:MAG: pentapeptide repeat-containing protein [Limnoraphis sp.]